MSIVRLGKSPTRFPFEFTRKNEFPRKDREERKEKEENPTEKEERVPISTFARHGRRIASARSLNQKGLHAGTCMVACMHVKLSHEKKRIFAVGKYFCYRGKEPNIPPKTEWGTGMQDKGELYTYSKRSQEGRGTSIAFTPPSHRVIRPVIVVKSPGGMLQIPGDEGRVSCHSISGVLQPWGQIRIFEFPLLNYL